MRVAVITPNNWANCGGNLAGALRYVGVDAGLYAPAARDPFGFVYDTVDKSWAEGADLFHVIDDMPGPQVLENLSVRSTAPIVQTVIGTAFRREGLIKQVVGRRHRIDEYLDDRIIARTADTPDLLYPEYDGELLPIAYPVEQSPVDWCYRNPPRFVHCPSNARKKGTDIIAFGLAENRRPFEYRQTSMLSHSEIDRARDGATIYIDQIGIGWYATSAIEAMSRGIPTMAYLAPEYGARTPEFFENCPVINLGFTRSQAARAISGVLDMTEAELEVLSSQSRAWALRWHGYRAVGQRAVEIYDRALGMEPCTPETDGLPY